MLRALKRPRGSIWPGRFTLTNRGEMFDNIKGFMYSSENNIKNGKHKILTKYLSCDKIKTWNIL
jgi:hypothetical protein